MSQIKEKALGRSPLSTYREVMQDYESRRAYLNTTQGILFGDPDQEGMDDIIERLNEVPVAFLFTADPTLPRPIFRTRELVYVGMEEIDLAISRFSEEVSS